jgi:biopolymer transport protein ExbD
MRLRGAKAVHYDSGPNMTPLVDVVMVILIFLMLAGQFSANEHYLVSSLPISKKGLGGAMPPGAIPPVEVNIPVEASGSRYVATVGDRHISDGQALQDALIEMHKTFPNPENVQVIITPGRQVTYKNLMEVYEAATAAQFSKIGFGVASH